MDLPDLLPDLPPIRNNGALTYSFQQQKRAMGETSIQSTETVTANPSTYIIEPWLATTNGTVNFSQTQSSGNTSSSATSVTGAMQVNILPMSDFPTEFSYSRYDRTIQLDTETSDLTGQAARLTARLALPDEWHAQLQVNEDDSEDSLGQAQVSHEASFDVIKRWSEDLLRVGLDHRDSIYTGKESSANGEAVINSLSVRQRSQPLESITSDSTSTLRNSTVIQKDFLEDNTVMQGVSTAIWRPREFRDITVNGAMRTFQESATTQRKGEMSERASQTAFGTLATSYAFDPRLVGNLGLNAGYSQNSATTSGSSGETSDALSITYGSNAGINYSAETISWEGFSYFWSLGNSFGVSANTTSSSSTSASNTSEDGTAGPSSLMWNDFTSVSQSLSRMIDLWVVDSVSFSASQSTGIGFDNQTGTQIPLTHSASISHTSREGSGWSVWSASASDSRSFGGTNSIVYDVINIQITQGYDPDRYSSINAALTFQAARQVSATSDTGFVDSIGGSVGYRERMVLGVDNLNFTSDLSFNPPSVLQRNRERDLGGAAARSRQQEGNLFGTQRWSNRLDYQIGQLRSSLVGRFDHDTSGINQSLMFQVSRRF